MLYKLVCSKKVYWLETEDWRLAVACAVALSAEGCEVWDTENQKSIFKNDRYQAALTQFLRKVRMSYPDFIETNKQALALAFEQVSATPVEYKPVAPAMAYARAFRGQI